MEILPYELLTKIVTNLKYEEILDLCRVNKLWNLLCKDDDFWRQKAFLDFGIEPLQFNDTLLDSQQRYLQIYSRFNVMRGSEKFKALNRCLNDSVVKGNLKQVKYFISKGATATEIGLYTAAKYGHLDLVEYFLDCGT